MESLGEYFHKHILLQKEKYEWLLKPLAELNMHVQRIANFGCSEGQETLTLMCMLGASEAIGIDMDEQNIRNAQSTLKIIQNIIWARGVPNDAPGFLKSPHLEEVVKFYPLDITSKVTNLPANYYDFVFCDFVLHKIWRDQGGRNETQTAIQEMVRVARSGGLIAAREPTQLLGDKTFEVDFGALFEKNGLRSIYIEQMPFEHGHYTKYVYSKENTA